MLLNKDDPVCSHEFTANDDTFIVDKMKQLQLQQAIKFANSKRIKNEVERVLEMEWIHEMEEAYIHATAE